MIQHSWLPRACCPGILDRDPNDISLYAELSERYGLALARGHTVISARLASPEEHRLLDLPAPSAVLIVDQVTYTRDGRPIELSRSVYHPERYPLSIVHGDGAPTRGVAAPWSRRGEESERHPIEAPRHRRTRRRSDERPDTVAPDR